MSKQLFTVGHSNLNIEEFIDLLREYRVNAIADVRSHPYSGYLPHLNRDLLKFELLKAKIKYVFLGEELGARPKDLSCYINGKALYTKIADSDSFKVGIQRILTGLDIGIIKPHQIIKCSNFNTPILHNCAKYVPVPFLESLPFSKRKTIQLVYTSKLEITKELNSDGRTKWKGTLINNFGYRLENASITDPEFVEQLESGARSQKPCLITVSLSLPFRPHENWSGEDSCWKLIAGVIELA